MSALDTCPIGDQPSDTELMSMTRAFRLIPLAVLSAVALVAPSGASAGVLTASAGNCTDGPVDQTFLRFADVANYTPAPGATAENAADWSLTGAAGLATGNEPWDVANTGSSNLRLPAGSSATTKTMCVGIEYPTIRFFTRSSGTTLLSSLAVDAQVETSLGLTTWVPVGVVPATSFWSPTLPYPVVANLLPLLPGERTPVRFRFTPVGTGTWSVDDVFVDPYRTN